MVEQRRAAIGIGVLAVAMCLAVLWPVARDGDGYPLSNYPMFARDRADTAAIDRVVAVDVNGVERALPPLVVGGTIEVIQAAETVSRAIRGGESGELCAEVLARLGADERAAGDAVEVVTETHHVTKWFEGATDPLERNVHARCDAS